MESWKIYRDNRDGCMDVLQLMSFYVLRDVMDILYGFYFQKKIGQDNIFALSSRKGAYQFYLDRYLIEKNWISLSFIENPHN